MASSYANLSRAQLTYEYLHTNSTTHEFLFGALAELVDNSRDANATELQIYSVPNEKFRGGHIVSFLDNGCGMDPTEVSQVIQFGRSSKRETGAHHIGQYGNGLKSGSMRIGKDMILFTKKEETMSCLFLSRTFHEVEDIHEVIVPMPSWYVKTKKPYLPKDHSLERHQQEVDIITKYSPYRSIEELLLQFDHILGKGTNVMIYNLKLMDNGESELNFGKDEKDIIMADPHADEVYDILEYVQPERVSFRAYLTLIYCEPRMKIYIQNEKIFTKKVMHNLFRPKSYIYTSTRFKKRSELEADAAEKAAKIAEERAKELTTQAREANAKHKSTSKDGRTAIQLAVSKADQAKFDADLKKKIAESKRKSSKEPKTLNFTFGFNINKRRCDGLFIYNCNRLIRMYEKVGPQTEGGVKCAGVVGVVDVPYLVLEPTHNKQDFADQKEYKHLLKSMADHMLQYWKDSKIETQGITKFWDDFGYTGQWRDDPSDDGKYKMKRLMSVPYHLQCDKCLKWRFIPFNRKLVNYDIPLDWNCSNNSDANYTSCSKPEQKVTIQAGRLIKAIKNLDDKRAEEVRKLQEKLDKKQSEIKKKNREHSPSPERSPSPVARRKQPSRREPSPPQKAPPSAPTSSPAKSKSSRKQRSPSPKPNKKAESPSPLPKRRRAKSPSPPPATKKRVSSPPPRRSKVKSPSPSPKRRASVTTPNKNKEQTSNDKNKRKNDNTKDVNEDNTPLKKLKKSAAQNNQKEKPVVIEEVLSSNIYPLQCKVEAKMHNTWYAGTVVSYKKAGEKPTLRVRVKFDKHSQDKFDKLFYETDPTLRVRNISEEKKDLKKGLVNGTKMEDPSTAIASQSSTVVAVSSSITTDDKDAKGELLEKVTYMLRKCLCYFRAPDFEKDKREILSLTPEQLRNFPINTFFDDYERNIKQQLQITRENLTKRAEEAEKRLKEVEGDKTKAEKDLKESKQNLNKSSKTLKELRLGVNVMLRSILNEDEKLDANDSSENVDIYLKTIVDQISEGAAAAAASNTS